MTETAPAAHPSEVFAARIAEFSDEFIDIARARAALDAREARLLARSAAFADATADALVPHEHTREARRTLARRSMCAMLSMAIRASEQTVQRATGEAELLVSEAPTVLEALESGRLSARHATVITEQLRDVPPAGRRAFLTEVLPLAERSTAARLKQRARVLRERLHPESLTARSARSETDRRVELEAAPDGMAWVHLFTTATLAHGIMERLDSLAAGARTQNDRRTCAQLRADALAALAISGTTPPADHTGTEATTQLPHPIEVLASVRATVQVTVPVMALLGINDTPATLDGYGPIDPETAARLTANAPSMARVLTHPETGAVLSVGREQYRVPADLQRAIRLRDSTCRAPGCNRRARACDLDHSLPWSTGGTTDAGNLACLCRHHHRLKHTPGWDLQHNALGALLWTTPDRRRHLTTPEPAPF